MEEGPSSETCAFAHFLHAGEEETQVESFLFWQESEHGGDTGLPEAEGAGVLVTVPVMQGPQGVPRSTCAELGRPCLQAVL